jgi:hypothetical protein
MFGVTLALIPALSPGEREGVSTRSGNAVVMVAIATIFLFSRSIERAAEAIASPENGE